MRMFFEMPELPEPEYPAALRDNSVELEGVRFSYTGTDEEVLHGIDLKLPASIDLENEHLIQGALSELTKGKTVITIAHRLATVENADQILVVEDGRIVQRGPNEELAEEEGLYRRFVEVRKKAEGWMLDKS